MERLESNLMMIQHLLKLDNSSKSKKDSNYGKEKM